MIMSFPADLYRSNMLVTKRSPAPANIWQTPIIISRKLPVTTPAIPKPSPIIVAGISEPRIYIPFVRGALLVQYGVIFSLIKPNSMSLK